MKELTKPYVHIKDKEKTEEKLQRLIEGSDDKLQVSCYFLKGGGGYTEVVLFLKC